MGYFNTGSARIGARLSGPVGGWSMDYENYHGRNSAPFVEIAQTAGRVMASYEDVAAEPESADAVETAPAIEIPEDK